MKVRVSLKKEKEKEREKDGRSKSGFLVVWFCCLKPEENRSAEGSGEGRKERGTELNPDFIT